MARLNIFLVLMAIPLGMFLFGILCEWLSTKNWIDEKFRPSLPIVADEFILSSGMVAVIIFGVAYITEGFRHIGWSIYWGISAAGIVLFLIANLALRRSPLLSNDGVKVSERAIESLVSLVVLFVLFSPIPWLAGFLCEILTADHATQLMVGMVIIAFGFAFHKGMREIGKCGMAASLISAMLWVVAAMSAAFIVVEGS